MTDEPKRCHLRSFDDLVPSVWAAAARIELFLCDAEIERRSRRLAALQAGLAGADDSDDADGGELSPSHQEIHTAIGCLLDHLRPAREVVRRFAASSPQPAEDPPRAPETADCLAWQWFLAGLEREALPPLRHLFGCPLCEQLTRALLFGFAGEVARPRGRPARRKRRRRRRPARAAAHPPSERR